MAHHRKAIRDALVTALTGLPTTGARLYVEQAYPIDTMGSLPGLSLHFATDEWNEEAQMIAVTPTSGLVPVERTLTAEVRAYAIGDLWYEDLDSMGLEVEQALGSDLELGGLVREIWYQSGEWEPTAELEQPGGVLAMEYTIGYRVDARDPQAAI